VRKERRVIKAIQDLKGFKGSMDLKVKMDMLVSKGLLKIWKLKLFQKPSNINMILKLIIIKEIFL
jgi:hypothetical protein